MGNTEAREVLDGAPEFPIALGYLWWLWCDVRRGRSPSFDGATLTWQDLAVWQELRHMRLSAFEIDILFDLNFVRPSDHSSERDIHD